MEEQGSIAQNLRLRMEAKDLGPKALSLKAGLNETYVRDILKGRSLNPRQGHLQKLAAALECHVSDLTGEAVSDFHNDRARAAMLAAFDLLGSDDHRRAIARMVETVVSVLVNRKEDA